jgi:hypothetical protein
MDNPFATGREYANLCHRADEVVRREGRFPEYVFTRRSGSLRWTDIIFPRWFELRDFAELHGDREISVIVLEPADDLDGIAGSGRRLAFTLSTRASRDDYFDVLQFSVNREKPFCIQDISRWVAIFGRSGRWAVFGENDLAAWWSEIPANDPEIAAWEIRRRPWAYTVEDALGLWGLAFRGAVVPDELATPFRRNYGSFDRDSDPEEGLPHVAPWDRSDEPSRPFVAELGGVPLQRVIPVRSGRQREPGSGTFRRGVALTRLSSPRPGG